MEVTLNDIPVYYVESPNGPAGSGEAFHKLESSLPSLRGRKFYATFLYSDGIYRACVAIDPRDDNRILKLDEGAIPGGKYAQARLLDWTQHADEIPGIFGKLSEEYANRIDETRPSIEFYKSQKELVCLIPIK